MVDSVAGRRSRVGVMLFLSAASTLAGCSSPSFMDPLAHVPLAQWRSTKVPLAGVGMPDGRIVGWPSPAHEATGCTAPLAGSGQWPRCLLAITAKDGYLIGFDRGYDPDRLTIDLDFQPNVYPSYRNMARGNEDQWPMSTGPEPDRKTPYEGVVRGRLEGKVDGHAYWAGCWRNYDGYPFAYGCMVAVDLGNDGAASGEYETQEPAGDGVYAPPKDQVERAVKHIVAIRQSFGSGDETAQRPVN